MKTACGISILSSFSVISATATSAAPAFFISAATHLETTRTGRHKFTPDAPEFPSVTALLAESSNDFFEAERPEWSLPQYGPESAKRRARLARERELRSRFVRGEELKDLRSNIKALEENVKWAEALKDNDRVRDLREEIKKAEGRDAELVYVRAMESIENLKKTIKIEKKKNELLNTLTEQAAMARESIPRFNLEGLWVGSYGEHGSELINVTYSGDTLIATKVTGGKHVPRGEFYFEADLSPRDENDSSLLEAIKLSESAALKWGVDKLPRYPGQGKIAGEGYKDANCVDGLLFLYDDYFSFIWVPTREHIFFSRPSAELTIHLLRDVISEEDRAENMREHVARCFEKDSNAAASASNDDSHDGGIDPFRRIHRDIDLEKAMEESDGDGGQRPPQGLSFRQITNEVLREDKD